MGNGKWEIAFNEEGQVLGPSKAKPESYVEVRFSGGAKGQVKVSSITKTKQVTEFSIPSYFSTADPDWKVYNNKVRTMELTWVKNLGEGVFAAVAKFEAKASLFGPVFPGKKNVCAVKEYFETPFDSESFNREIEMLKKFPKFLPTWIASSESNRVIVMEALDGQLCDEVNYNYSGSVVSQN